eukprot:scaffold213373_cov23-Prasinocladus_malaysianus.AAC.1
MTFPRCSGPVLYTYIIHSTEAAAGSMHVSCRETMDGEQEQNVASRDTLCSSAEVAICTGIWLVAV